MSSATFVFTAPQPTDGTGHAVASGSDIPAMRARSGCSFWACKGPSRPKPMTTCVKCHAMRGIATVRATLAARHSKGASHAST